MRKVLYIPKATSAPPRAGTTGIYIYISDIINYVIYIYICMHVHIISNSIILYIYIYYSTLKYHILYIIYYISYTIVHIVYTISLYIVYQKYISYISYYIIQYILYIIHVYIYITTLKFIYIYIHVLRILHLSCIQSTSGCAITVPLPRYQDLAWEFLDCRPVRYGRKIAIFLAG